MEEKNITTKHRAYLDSVVFNRKKDFFGPIEVKLSDSFADIKINGNIISFHFIRHVSLSPEALFDITVSFLYEGELVAEIVEKYKNKKIETNLLATLINRTTVPQHASTIIANLTGVNKSNPLVTVPVCTAK